MKKIPTLYVRDPEDRRYVTDEVTRGCEWVLVGEGVPTRKCDGTCIRVQNDSEAYAIWARREVKPGRTPPVGFVPLETDEITGKTVGWEPWLNSPFAKFIEEGVAAWAEEHQLPDAWHSDLRPGTYELIGPKINGNPEKVSRHELVRHADADVPSLLLREGFDDGSVLSPQAVVWYLGQQGWEGLVWHHPDGRMAKLKARDLRPAATTGDRA